MESIRGVQRLQSTVLATPSIAGEAGGAGAVTALVDSVALYTGLSSQHPTPSATVAAISTPPSVASAPRPKGATAPLVASASPLATALGSPAIEPYTRATVYRRADNGTFTRQTVQQAWDKHVTAPDARGQTWHAFTALDRGYKLRVLDGDGQVVLNLDYGKNVGSSSGSGWLSSMTLDPPRQRLYLVSGDALHAFDLTSGTEVAKLPRADPYDLDKILVTSDGRLFGTRRNAVEELTPDLAPVRRVAVEGFIPGQLTELPGGCVAAAGSLIEESGKVKGGYDSNRVIFDRDGVIRSRGQQGTGGAVVGPDGADWIIEKGERAVRRTILQTGETRQFALETSARCVLPRADGSFVTVDEDFHTLEMSLYSAAGSRVETFTFPRAYSEMQNVFLSDDGRSAYVQATRLDDGSRLQGRDLIRLDLDKSATERIWRRVSRRADDMPGERLYSAPDRYTSRLLPDGRIALWRPTQADLLDARGSLLQSCRVDDAESAPVFVSTSGPATVDPDLRNAWLSMRVASSSGDRIWQSEESVDEVAVPKATVSATTADPSDLWRISAARREFPVGLPYMMKVEPGKIVVQKENGHATEFRPPNGERFTDVIALQVGDLPYVAAGTDGGAVVLGRADYPDAGRVPHVYPTGHEVVRLGLVDGSRVVAECRDGSAVAIDLPLWPGERAQMASEKGASEPAVPGTIDDHGDDVVIGGVRVPKRQPAG